MPFVTKKLIKGKHYLYAEHSFRLPNKKIKKISKKINKEEELQQLRTYFIQEETKAHINHAKKHYETTTTINDTTRDKIEEHKVEFKHITNTLSKQQRKDLLDRFAINLTYESNAIEGNSLTLKDVTLLLHEKKTPKDKELREIYETRNTRQAIDELFKKKPTISKEEILRIHKIIIQDTGIQEGFKRFPNFLLMRDVKTTPPEKVEEEIEQLIQEYKQSQEHPLIKATKFHARFERIHPFEDGNGRVGRILLNAILLEHNYPPIIIRKTARQAYLKELAAYDQRHKQKLEQFIINKYKQTFEKFFKIYVQYL